MLDDHAGNSAECDESEFGKNDEDEIQIKNETMWFNVVVLANTLTAAADKSEWLEDSSAVLG